MTTRCVLLIAASMLTISTASAQPKPQSSGAGRVGPETVYVAASTVAPEAPKGSADGHIKEAHADPVGAFATEAEIALPAFHGLEPKLALVYQSSSGNSLAGVGVSVSGFSSIERLSKGRGVPLFDDALDSYYLDGIELLPCGSQSPSPGCRYHDLPSGTVYYFTKAERYELIGYDPTSQLWTLQRKDGVRAVYGAASSDAIWRTNTSKPSRWELSSMADTSGNAVTYFYWRDTNGASYWYPDRIVYNGTTIRFYLESRPDSLWRAVGDETMVQMRKRIALIDVVTRDPSTGSDKRVRAYKLSYASSGMSGQSLLRSVQQFGNDAIVDPSTATVTNATTASSYPPVALGWLTSPQASASSTVAGVVTTSLPATLAPAATPATTRVGVMQIAYPDPLSNANVRHVDGDVNGDGLGDHVIVYRYFSVASCQFIPCSSTVARSSLRLVTFLGVPGGGFRRVPGEVDTLLTQPYETLDVSVGDMNGDGSEDVVIFQRRSPDNSWSQSGFWSTEPEVWGLEIFSFNVDETTPLYKPSPYIRTTIPIAEPPLYDVWGSANYPLQPPTLSDENGDGLPDVVRAALEQKQDGSYAWFVRTAINDAREGFAQQIVKEVTGLAPELPTADDMRPTERASFGDFNGDGRGDVAIWAHHGADAVSGGEHSAVVVVTPRLNGSIDLVWTDLGLPWTTDTDNHLLTGDVNRDGRTDLVVAGRSSGGTLSIQPLYGAPGFGGLVPGTLSDTSIPFPGAGPLSNTYPTMGDLDADGRADLSILYKSTTNTALIVRALAAPLASTDDVSFSATLVDPGLPFPVSTNCQYQQNGYPKTDGCVYPTFAAVSFNDVEGDGRNDVVVWDSKYDVRWDLIDHPHELSLQPLIRLAPHTSQGGSWMPADLNGDGLLDLMLVTQLAAGVRIDTRLRQADGTFVAGPTEAHFVDTAGLRAADFQLADLNGDGRADLVHGRAVKPTGLRQIELRTLRGSGNGGFVESKTVQTLYHPKRGLDLRIMDVDGDGDDDVVHIGRWGSWPGDWNELALESFFSDGNGGFEPARIGYASLSESYLTAMALQAVDVNGDGRGDLVSVSRNPQTGSLVVYSLISGGDGYFRVVKRGVGVPLDFGPRHPGQYLIGDVDGNGTPDLVTVAAARRSDGLFDIWMMPLLGRGDGTFAAGILYAWSGFDVEDERDWQLADGDGDGRADLVHARFLRRTRCLKFETDCLGGFRPSGVVLDTIALKPSASSFADKVTSTRTIRYGAFAPGFWRPASEVRRAVALAALEHASGNATTGTLRVETVRVNGPRDLLQTVDNTLGGRATATYAPLLAQAQLSDPASGCRLPPGGGQVVSAIAVAPSANGPQTTTTLGYTCPRWSSRERKLLGWTSTRIVEPAASNRPATTTDTTYDVSDACGARTFFQSVGDGANTRYHYTYFVAPGSQPPYLCERYLEYESEVDASWGFAARMTRFEQDEWGEDALEYRFGDLYVSGDELTVQRRRAKASGLYISTVSGETTFSGTGITGQRLRDVAYCYDDPNGCSPTALNRGLRVATRVWDDQTNLWLPTKQTYDAWGNVLTVTDAESYITSTTYDTAFHLYPVSETDAVNNVIGHDWDRVLGLDRSWTDANGRIHALRTYDGLGRPTFETEADGGLTRWEYHDYRSGDQYVWKSLPDGTSDGLWSKTWVDGLGRVTKMVKEGVSGDVTQTVAYADASTRVAAISHWFDAMTAPVFEALTYDYAGRVTSVTHPDGASKSTVYVASGRVETDETGAQKRIYKDGHGRLARVEEVLRAPASVQTTFYRHDVLGNLREIEDALGNKITMSWSSLGWKTAENDPDRGSWTFGHDRVGNLAWSNDANGHTIYYGYDGLRRMTSKSNADNAREVRWTYDQTTGHGDGRGHLTSMTDSQELGCALAASLMYDAMGRVIWSQKCVGGIAYAIGTSFDTMGRMWLMVYPDGESVTYQYDGAGQLSAVPGYVTRLDHDIAGKLVATQLANGATESFQYSPLRDWLEVATLRDVTGATIYGATYQYRANALLGTADWSSAVGTSSGQSTTTRGAQSAVYGYDDLGRLTSVAGTRPETFQYDAIGNLTWTSLLGTYSYPPSGPNGCGTGWPCPGVHAVEGVGGDQLFYDGAGNLIERDRGNKADLYDWDDDHRMTSAATLDLSTWAWSGQVTMSYDPDGERVKKTSSAGTSYFFGPGIERDAAGNLVKYVFAGPRLVARRVGSGARSFYVSDRLGSTRLMLDGNGYSQVDSDYEYSPFGRLLNGTASLAAQILYTGHRSDDETGLIYMHARHYDPKLARFVSADPVIPDLDNPQALNRYSYVYNNPIANVDPTGNAPEDSSNYPAQAVRLQLIPKADRLCRGECGLEGSLIVGRQHDRSPIVRENKKYQVDADGENGKQLDPKNGLNSTPLKRQSGESMHANVDAYVAVPWELNQAKGNGIAVGGLAVAVREDTGQWIVLPIGDVGNKGRPSNEISIAAAEQLGLRANPNNADESKRVTVIYIPFSGDKVHRGQGELRELLDTFAPGLADKLDKDKRVKEGGQ